MTINGLINLEDVDLAELLEYKEMLFWMFERHDYIDVSFHMVRAVENGKCVGWAYLRKDKIPVTSKDIAAIVWHDTFIEAIRFVMKSREDTNEPDNAEPG